MSKGLAKHSMFLWNSRQQNSKIQFQLQVHDNISLGDFFLIVLREVSVVDVVIFFISLVCPKSIIYKFSIR